MVLGVLGKIASGKTEVMNILRECGFYCIFADEVVRELYESGGEGAKKILEVFGSEYLNGDGGVDRKKLRDLVFVDAFQLNVLNKVIHPLVCDVVGSVLDGVNVENVAIEAVYFDDGFLRELVDKVVWIERPVESIKRVLVEERGFLRDMAEKAVEMIERPSDVDFLVSNHGSLSDLREAVLFLVR